MEFRKTNWSLINVYFDEGATIPGAKLGPKYISSFVKKFDGPDNTQCEYKIVGNYNIIPEKQYEKSLSRDINNAIEHTLKTEAQPFFIGGDHSISYYILSNLAERFPSIIFLFFDAHLDILEGEEVKNWNFVRLLGKKENIRIINVGARGNELLKDANFKVISSQEVVEKGIKETAREINGLAGESPLYISIDLDVLDPAYAPGVSSKSGCGLSPLMLSSLLSGLKRANLVGCDIVEFNPLLDKGNLTLLQIQSLMSLLLNS